MADDAPAGAGARTRFRALGSVRARVTVLAVAVLAGALAVAAVILVTVVRDSLVHNLDEAVEVIADDVAARVAAGSLPEVIPVAGGPVDDDLVIQVVDAGRVVAASENFPSTEPILAEVPGDGRLVTTARLAIDPEEDFRVTGLRVRSASGRPVSVFVAAELEPVQLTEKAVRRAVGVGAPALLVLSGLLVRAVVGRALGPVEAIRRQVDDISGSALGQRVPVPGGRDEISRLAETMNAMLARLEVAAERQRRFTSDASHELRSPLASSRAALEVGLVHPHTTTWEATAAHVLEETERMERLVTDLLLLARGDEGRLLAEAGDVDLRAVVLAEAGRLGERGHVTVDVSAVLAARVRGTAEHLARVARNLLENAEGQARSAVTVSVASSGGQVFLVVVDDGPGVPLADRERIFDRFVRLDDSRAYQGRGAGLGLAITRELVRAHGGSVGVEDGPGGGARFVVRLPSGG